MNLCRRAEVSRPKNLKLRAAQTKPRLNLLMLPSLQMFPLLKRDGTQKLEVVDRQRAPLPNGKSWMMCPVGSEDEDVEA